MTVPRELCPLPFVGEDIRRSSADSLSASVQHRLTARLAAQRDANEAITALNEIWGHGNFNPTRHATSAAQSESVSRILAAARRAGGPSHSPQEALKELQGCMPGYGAEDASTGKLASYQKDLISLPNVGGALSTEETFSVAAPLSTGITGRKQLSARSLLGETPTRCPVPPTQIRPWSSHQAAMLNSLQS